MLTDISSFEFWKVLICAGFAIAIGQGLFALVMRLIRSI